MTKDPPLADAGGMRRARGHEDQHVAIGHVRLGFRDRLSIDSRVDLHPLILFARKIT